MVLPRRVDERERPDVTGDEVCAGDRAIRRDIENGWAGENYDHHKRSQQGCGEVKEPQRPATALGAAGRVNRNFFHATCAQMIPMAMKQRGAPARQ